MLRKPAKGGRPEKASVEEVIALLEGKELVSKAWQEAAEVKLDIKRGKFLKLKAESIEEGYVEPNTWGPSEANQKVAPPGGWQNPVVTA